MATAAGPKRPVRVTSARPRPRPRAKPSPTPPLPTWAALCFLISGAAGLLYEIVWSKQLSFVMGSSLHAIATVVAAFLCGLALGAWLLGGRLATRGRGPRTYAWLELLIGAAGVLSMPALRGLDPVVGVLYRTLGGETPALLAVRFALLFGLLLLPTMLMGATLPVLVGHFERRAGPALARLYSLNTLGAVLGSALAGFALLPGIGLTATTWVAAGLNLLAGALAFRFGGARSPDPERDASVASPQAPLDTPPPLLARGPRLAVASLLAFSGFAALAFQIAWVRLYGLLLGSSVYSFSAVLAVYLAALAAGSAAIGRWLRRAPEDGGAARLLTALAALELVVAIVTLAAARLFPWLPEALLDLSQDAGGSWTRFYVGELGLVALVVALPCAAFGAIFPIAARLLQTRSGGHAAGVAFAVNTAGTLLGSVLAGFLLVPVLGVRGTHLTAALLVLGCGLVAAAAAIAAGASRPRLLGTAAAAVALAGILAWSAPPWNPLLMSAGLYRPVVARQVASASARESTRRLVAAERTLFYREGLNGSVYVGTDSAGIHRWLKVGGKTDASTADMLTQVLLGTLPAAFAGEGARTAVIGLGSGVTVAAARAAGAGDTEVMEIERAVVDASRYFHAPGRHPLDDPRVTLVLGDARTRLFDAEHVWDVIVSEPSNPWIAGVNNLFTLDFYRRLRARLAPEGVFCQWIQLYELAPETLASMLRTFLEVFPSGHAFVIRETQDLLLVATPPGDTLSLGRLSRPETVEWLARANQAMPVSVAAWYACPFDSLRPLAAGAPFNRDDLPIVEYWAPRDLYRIGRQARSGSATDAIPVVGWVTAAGPFATWPKAAWFEGRARQLARSGYEAAARRTAADADMNGLPGTAADIRRAIDTEFRARELVRLKDQARLAAPANRWTEARDALRRAAELDPADGETWVMLADAHRKLGETDAARAAVARAVAVGDSMERAYAHMVEGGIESAAQRPRAAAAAFAEAVRWQPANEVAWIQLVQALRVAGDSAAARAAAVRGSRHVPESSALRGLAADPAGFPIR